MPCFASERSDNYALSGLQRLSYRLTASLCSGVIANSHAGASYAARWHRLPAQRLSVVWNGIDLGEIDARLRVAQPVATSYLRPASDSSVGAWSARSSRRRTIPSRCA